MIIINNVFCPLNTDFKSPEKIVSEYLKIKVDFAKLYRKSVDARKKDNILFCCSFIAEIGKEEKRILKKYKNTAVFKEEKYEFKKFSYKTEERPYVIGFGPAGMFAALYLARAGLKPVVAEQGADIETRIKDVENYFKTGVLNERSNIQSGEGGAGTFSDGKLNTGIKDKRCRAVLKEFVNFGADESILTDAKPHIGTDVLRKIVVNIRKEIEALGGEVRFNTKFEDFVFSDGALSGIYLNGISENCSFIILACGHSARDTFKMLLDNNIEMIKKPFSVGVRIEHKRENIDKALYGKFAGDKRLGAASYKLACHLEDGRGVYTFCMCPGGEVVNSSDRQGAFCVNGMSYKSRDLENSNSAVLVSVEPKDLEGGILSGCEFQERIEKSAFKAGCGKVPVSTVGSFVFGQDVKIGEIKPTVKPEFIQTDLSEIFPEFVVSALKKGIVEFDKKISGFADKNAVLTAPETRSSSPVRIVRDENLESASLKGLYPCGEGAGYAGGIMSAAVDGLKCAEAVFDKMSLKFCKNGIKNEKIVKN